MSWETKHKRQLTREAESETRMFFGSFQVSSSGPEAA